jgi:DNA-binding transcriptional ArsR family regulator
VSRFRAIPAVPARLGANGNLESPMTDGTTARKVDRVFFALADATRRSLLDRLYVRDGQRVGELAEAFAMSRQAISKHLDVLEDAGLVVTRRDSRETRHFLNRAPMREVQAQWIDKFTRLQVRIDCS